MATSIDRAWLTALPKAENYVHHEGCLAPAVVERAAACEGLEAPTGTPATLDELLHVLDMSCRLMTEADGLADLAIERARAAAEIDIRDADLIINPNHWPAR